MELESENKLLDALKNIPEQGTSIAVLKQMSSEGINEIIIKEEKVLLPLVQLNRNHQFNNIEKFCNYIKKFKYQNTVVYFDNQGSLAHCVIDEFAKEGSPEIIQCQTMNKKLFYLIENIERIQSSNELLFFVKSNKKKIEDFTHFYQTMSALKISSSVEKLDVQGKSSEYNYIIKAEVKGVVKGGPVELPERLVLLFEDNNNSQAEFYKINADIYYTIKNNNEVHIQIIVENKDDLFKKMSENYFEILQNNLPTDVLLVYGYPKYENVKRYGKND